MMPRWLGLAMAGALAVCLLACGGVQQQVQEEMRSKRDQEAKAAALQRGERWTAKDRPAWAVKPTDAAERRVYDSIAKGFEGGEFVSLSLTPNVLRVDRGRWDKESKPDKRGLFYSVSLYLRSIGEGKYLEIRDAETDKLLADENTVW